MESNEISDHLVIGKQVEVAVTITAGDAIPEHLKETQNVQV